MILFNSILDKNIRKLNLTFKFKINFNFYNYKYNVDDIIDYVKNIIPHALIWVILNIMINSL